MSFNFGSSKGGGQQGGTTIQQVSPSPQTPEEKEMQQLALESARRNAQTQALYTSSGQEAADQELARAGSQYALARIRGEAPLLTPAQETQLNTIQSGQQGDFAQWLNQAMAEQSGMSGLRPTDTPIANAKALALSNFGRGLAQTRASAALDLSRASDIYSQFSQQQTGAIRQQQAQQQLAQAMAAAQLQQQLFGQRMAVAPQTLNSNQMYSNWGTNYGAGVNMNPSWNSMTGLSMGPQGRGLGY